MRSASTSQWMIGAYITLYLKKRRKAEFRQKQRHPAGSKGREEVIRIGKDGTSNWMLEKVGVPAGEL